MTIQQQYSMRWHRACHYQHTTHNSGDYNEGCQKRLYKQHVLYSLLHVHSVNHNKTMKPSMFQNLLFICLLAAAPEHTSPLNSNIYNCLPHGFKCIYSNFHAAMFWPKKTSCHDLLSDPCIKHVPLPFSVYATARTNTCGSTSGVSM